MEKLDANYPTVEIPSRVQILMINEHSEEIVIDNPNQISPEQLMLMEELVTVLKRAVGNRDTASGESQSASSSGASASAETPPTSEKRKELEEGVHRAIKMTIEDPSYDTLRQSFSVEISYFNISLNVNIDAPED